MMAGPPHGGCELVANLDVQRQDWLIPVPVGVSVLLSNGHAALRRSTTFAQRRSAASFVVAALTPKSNRAAADPI